MKTANLKKPLISFIVCIFILFSAELFLRKNDISERTGFTNIGEMFNTGVFKRDRLLFWRFSPSKFYTKPSTHYKGVLRVNSIGFREREISKEKGQQTYRIFCLGGSNTCGEGLFENERFSNIVEQKLNSLPGALTFEVYNFGMPGYSTLQMLRLFKNELINFNPDLIIVNPEQADGLGLSGLAPFSDSKVKILPAIFFNLTCFLEDNSSIYRLVKQNLLNDSWRLRNKRSGNSSKSLVRVTLEEHKDNLSEMLKLAENKGVKIIFLTGLGIRDDKVVNVDKDYGCQPSIDITPLFKDGQKNGLFQDQGHISAKGHYLVAELLAEYIKNNLF
ncbi:MAG: SGNH/GDSL hydrolase family protein [Candidatus Omnitrophica bacterium]|nr:SGNH/GDSL hydrolase family protein [Candidatus Omnitrophota bacterium]